MSSLYLVLNSPKKAYLRFLIFWKLKEWRCFGTYLWNAPCNLVVNWEFQSPNLPSHRGPGPVWYNVTWNHMSVPAKWHIISMALAECMSTTDILRHVLLASPALMLLKILVEGHQLHEEACSCLRNVLSGLMQWGLCWITAAHNWHATTCAKCCSLSCHLHSQVWARSDNCCMMNCTGSMFQSKCSTSSQFWCIGVCRTEHQDICCILVSDTTSWQHLGQCHPTVRQYRRSTLCHRTFCYWSDGLELVDGWSPWPMMQ